MNDVCTEGWNGGDDPKVNMLSECDSEYGVQNPSNCADVIYGWPLRGYWERRHEPNILFITYEEMKRDLPDMIRYRFPRIFDRKVW